MATLTGLIPSEMERIKWCQGCRWLSVAGQNGCCDYIFYHDHRRPCAFGEGCTVKSTGKVKRVWRIRPQDPNAPIQPERRRAGPREKIWDKARARALYEQGVTVDEICKRIGIGRRLLAKERERSGWVRKSKVIKTMPCSWDTEEGRRLYEIEGVGPTALAARYGVAVSTVQMYATRHGWVRGPRR